MDVVGRYVRLKRTGSGYMGLCPFHGEKTPSFSVSEQKQFYYCFGCGESGDVITFVQKIENVDFLTAVGRLADAYGINMDDFGFRNEGRNSRLYEMNREAAIFYLHNLADRPNPGRDYILGRGLNLKTVAKFGLGYAPPSWNSLLEHMTAKGYEPAQLVRAGLLSSSKGRYYDKFRDRVIFPIVSTRGKVLGFGGRLISDGQPKYLNSPESPVFSKRNHLFGLNLTGKEISREDCAIIVEGYMDLISLYQHGITNVAATLGTALTAEQCRMLKRYTENILLSYDADQAGRNAALRGIEVIRNEGMNARVLHVTDGKDPDEFVRKYGKEAFLQLTEQALPYADYRLEHARLGLDLSLPQDRRKYIREAAAIIHDLDPLDAETYIGKIAEETEVQEGVLRRELAVLSSSGTGTKPFPEKTAGGTIPTESRTGTGRNLQKILIGLMAKDSRYLEGTRPYEHVFTDPACARIVSVLFNLYDEEGSIDINRAADSLDAEAAAVFDSMVRTEVLDHDTDKIWQDCISRIKISELKEKHQNLENILELLSENDERTETIMNQLREIDATILRLKNEGTA